MYLIINYIELNKKWGLKQTHKKQNNKNWGFKKKRKKKKNRKQFQGLGYQSAVVFLMQRISYKQNLSPQETAIPLANATCNTHWKQISVNTWKCVFNTDSEIA